MIAYVSGKLVDKKPTSAIIDVQGLGYALHIPASSFAALPAVGATVKLLTYQHVREDALLLFGFVTEAERLIFEAMLNVSGIGPKLALAALSAMSPTELHGSIVQGDAGLLTRIPGVGRKTAERMVIELRDRVAHIELAGLGASPLGSGSPEQAKARTDALAALESLGLSRAAAEKSLRKTLRAHPGIQTADELTRLALRNV
jgi:Holliday junction DNA helicase RuvA